MNTTRCYICKEVKDNSCFYKTKKTGLIVTQCKSCCKKRISEWRKKNREQFNKNNLRHRRKYVAANREKVIETRKSYFKKQLEIDDFFRRNKNIRGSLNLAMVNNIPGRFWEKIVDCTVIELRKYIRERFQKGMSWKNHGKGYGKWNIDHIIPVSYYRKLKGSVEERLKECWRLENLQPLWACDNMKKFTAMPSLSTEETIETD